MKRTLLGRFACYSGLRIQCIYQNNEYGHKIVSSLCLFSIPSSLDVCWSFCFYPIPYTYGPFGDPIYRFTMFFHRNVIGMHRNNTRTTRTTPKQQPNEHHIKYNKDPAEQEHFLVKTNYSILYRSMMMVMRRVRSFCAIYSLDKWCGGRTKRRKDEI